MDESLIQYVFDLFFRTEMPKLLINLSRLNLFSATTFLGLAFSVAPAVNPCAYADTIDIKYSISLSVLPIGVAYIDGKVNPDTYKIEAGVKLTGLASLIISAKAIATATGAFSAGRSLPATYAITASNAKINRTIRMAVSGGTVSALDINPPFDEAPDRIPVTDTHKRNIIDPLAGLVMPFTGDTLSASVCNRTLPVFDGGARFDIALSYSDTHDIKLPGYEGAAIVCTARYTPIAGHRADRPSTKFMAENRDLEIWLAPVNATHVAVPYRISVKTMTGTAVIQATEFNFTH